MDTDEIAPGTLVRLVGDMGVHMAEDMIKYGVKMGDLGVVLSVSRPRYTAFEVRIFNDVDPSAPWTLERRWIEVVES